MAKSDGSVIIDTRMNTSGFQTGVADMKKGFGGLSSALSKIGKLMLVVFSVKQLVQFGKEAIELGSDLSEVQNVVDVTFGNLNQEINNFASNAIEQFGLSETAAKQYTSTMGAMLKSMGFTTRQAADMSMTMTGLAADMASFYNLNAEDAFYKIRAGISGETEPLKQLGINLNVANLEQYALTQGITKSYNAMTQQEQAMLRYNYLLKVTADAQGDFARTSDSWANQTRILSERFKALKATIGQGLINIFTPVVKVINILLGKLTAVANAFKAFTELITGNKSSGVTGSQATNDGLSDVSSGYDSAADGAENYADATEDAADATKKANKANKTYLSGLDEIRRYSEDITEIVPEQKGNSGGTLDELPGVNAGGAVDYGSLAEGETIADELSGKFLALKDILTGLFKPFQESWAMEGQGTVDAASTALSSIWELAQSVGKSFYDVWTNGTGTTTLSTILEIAKNILTTAGNLAGKFTEAWNTAGTGTSIIQGIFDLLNIVLGTIRDMSGATAEWAKTLDFTPLLTSINDLLIALQPLAQNIGDGLAWFYQNVLLPLASFTIEEIIPRYFETLSGILGVVNAVLEALQPLFQWFWDSVLLPIAEWTGGIFLQIWDGINTALQAFATWCEENPEFIQNAAIVVGAFFAAFELASIITGVITTIQGLIGIISGAGGLSGVLGTLISALNGPLVIAIGAVIAAGVLLYKNWDKVKETAKQLWDNVLAPFADFLKGAFLQAWEEYLSPALEYLYQTVLPEVIGTFKNLWETVLVPFGEFLSGIFKPIFDTLIIVLKDLWENIIIPLADVLGTKFKNAFEAVSTILNETVIPAVGAVVSALQNLWDNILVPVGNFLKDTFGPAFEAVFGNISDIISDFGETQNDVIDLIEDVFAADWEDAWEGIRDIFTDVFDGLVDLAKVPLNSIIGAFNSVLGVMNGIVSRINGIKFKITIPSWIPGIGGNWWGFDGFNIPSIGTIPYLAQGAVIPPNAPFAAVLGDQKRGTNVEAPLSTIEQAVTNALKKSNSGAQNITIRVPVILDGRQVFEAVITEAKMKQLVSGRNPFEMG